MAHVKYPHLLTPCEDVEFDDIHDPGEPAPLSGLYRCEACGASLVRVSGQPLPGAEYHPPHADGGAIAWRLVVRAHLK